MPSTATHLGPSRVKLVVEIPFADLQPHLDRAYRDIAQQITIPGFRKGKVPPAVINQRFGRGAVLQEAINDALPQAYATAVEEAGIVPLMEPEIEVTKLEDGEVVEFAAEVDIRPDFEIPAFDTLTATVDALPDSQAEFDARMELLRGRFATTTEVDRPAAVGDQVTVNLIATRDGAAIENGASEGVNYVVGVGGMLDGLDETVTGMSAGESATFTSTLLGGPEEGQQADIAVEVVKVSSRELPDIDDDFAQLVSEFDTMDEMRADLTGAIMEQAKQEQAAQGRDRVLEALVAATDFELPQRLVDAEVAARKQDINDQLGRAGLTLESYLENAGDEAKTPDEFWARLESGTVQGLKAQIILEKVAEDSQVQVEQADLSELLIRKSMQNGTSPEQEAKHMMEHDHAQTWMSEIRRNKALALIVAQANVTDPDGGRVDVSVPQRGADEG